MALTPQVHFGNPLITSGGEIAGICCCQPEEPSSCPNPEDPEIYITISKSGYAGADITWCNETFTAADVAGAVEKGPVCPTFYRREQKTSTVPNSPVTGYFRQFWKANEVWQYNTASGLILGDGAYTLFAIFQVGTPPVLAGNYYLYQVIPGIAIKPNGSVFADSLISSTFGGGSTARPMTSRTGIAFTVDIGILAKQGTNIPFASFYVPPLYYSDYGIRPRPGFPSGFFGSHTDINGFTYTWRRGNGW